MSSRLQLDMRNLSLGRRHLVNAYEVEAGIGVIAGNTVWSMPECLECEVLQKAHYINALTFTRTIQIFKLDRYFGPNYTPRKSLVCLSKRCNAIMQMRFCWLSRTNTHTDTCPNTRNHLRVWLSILEHMTPELVCWHTQTQTYIHRSKCDENNTRFHCSD